MEKDGNDGTVLPTHNLVPRPKKRGPLSLLRAATFFVRGSSRVTKKAPGQVEAPEATNGKWSNLVGGMRPLHVRGHSLPALPPPPPMGHEMFHDTSLPPPSPAHSLDGMSRYASAEDLQALDDVSEVDEEAAATEGKGEPNAIDMQAEAFIASFYQQMMLEDQNES